MHQDAHLVPVLLRGGLGAFLVAGLFLSSAACTRLPQKSRPDPKGSVASDGGLLALLGPLRRQSDLNTCRNLIPSLNAYLNRNSEQRLAILPEAEQEFLKQHLKLDDDELAEVSSPTFTLLDAHHLHERLLLRDAALALRLDGLPAAARAEAAFGWTVRQVRLDESSEGLSPPGAVLYRGWGNDRERSIVFLGLLEQLDIPGCMIALPGGVPWIPGALLDSDLVLFETRLGIPLPRAAGKGPRTLRQLAEPGGWLEQLSAFNYDVTAEQARRAEVQLLCSLSALSARMGRLHQALGGSVRVSQDARTLQAQFRQSLPASEVRFWAAANQPAPARLLRAFLPPEEGGSDKSRWRQRRFELTLTPWQALPEQVRAIPESVDLGEKLRRVFEVSFLDLYQEPGRPRDLILRGNVEEAVARLVDGLDQLRQRQALARQATDLETAFNRWCREARKAQEDVLLARRRLTGSDTSANRAALAAAQRQLLALGVQRKLQDFVGWCHELRQAQEDLLLARRQLSAGDSRETRALLKEAEQHLHRVESRRQEQSAILFMSEKRDRPLAVEMTYLLALAKHEQAERTQARLENGPAKDDSEAASARQAWQSAADWWQKFLDFHPAGAGDGAGRLALAQALAALGQQEAARALLKDPAEALTGWNQQAVRYRLRQLKGQ